LRKIFLARTTAYWQYGPVSPSKLKRVLEVECDDRRTREFQKEISQRADGDRVRDDGAFVFGRCGVALVHLGARGGFQAIEQIIRFHAQTLSAAYLNVWLLRFLLTQRVSQLGGAAGRERDDLVGKVNRAIGLLVETERAKAGNNHVFGK